ncbi:DUF177 domain-containing protein [Actinomyces sp. MRS3W]|uniref:YceD family protein n=1 Tax=Actinomyces sp. MRS3W TaxID=2800796 RepID=UPI0028FD2FCB|nr:DUF177 domain-containing protein [Actinomyces sp. MRS3W]MDU0347295.1 DUF177 domain-containing protein [Actinomyces sp. MRS3W]
MATTAGLVVDIIDLPQQTGAIKQVHVEAPAPADLGTEMIGAPEGSPMVVDAELTSLDNGVLARGRADVHIHGQCVRCLRDIDDDVTVSFDELYFTPEAAAAQADEGDEEADALFTVDGTSLDLERALRDALVLTLPFQPLCREDCAGLCSECGERLDDLPPDHHHEQLDPRWSALADLLADSAADGEDAADSAAGAAESGSANDAEERP